jgi:hypothetical protein
MNTLRWDNGDRDLVEVIFNLALIGYAYPYFSSIPVGTHVFQQSGANINGSGGGQWSTPPTYQPHSDFVALAARVAALENS